MAYQGINTGTGPNSGTGDTLLSGADKINSNFEELYTLLGNGSTLAVGIVTGIVAGDNVSVSSTFGTVTVSAATSGIVVTGPSTFIGLTTVTGDLYVSGDLYVADDIQYDEVNGRNLNISGVGTVTTLGVTTLTVSGVSTLGVTTFNGNVSVGSSFFFGDNNQIIMGAQDDFQIYHTDSDGNALRTNVGNLNIIGNNANMVSLSGTAVVMATNPDSNFGVEFYYNNVKRFETRPAGVDVTGRLNATSFAGDGANLTGITTLIQAGNNITVTTNSGITTISSTGGGGGGITTAVINADSINVSGLSTFTGNVSCGQSLLLGDNGRILIGDAPDLQIYHDGDNSYIKDLIGTGALRIDSSFTEIRNAVGDKRTATFSSGTGASGGAQLYFDGTKRYETTSTGGFVTGILTATEFYGDGSNLTGVGGGNTANVSTNTLNVIGVTTASDVNISGIVTAGIGTIRSLRVGAGVGPSAPNGQLAVVNATGVAALTVGQNVDGSGQNHLGFYYNGPAAPVAAQMFTSNGRLRFVTDGGGGGALPLAQQSGFQFGVNGNFSNLPLVAIHDVSAAAGVSTALVVNGSTLLNDGLNVTGVTTANSFEGNGSNLVSGRWVLGANGSSDYTFTGIGFTESTNDPDIYLARGSVYEFVNNMGAHPFRIQSTPNGSAGTVYSNGVTNNDATNGTVRFEVTMNAPNTLYYQCVAHPGMGGTIFIYPELR